MDANFWKGKKVLITGHTGFKGSWLSLWLSNMGAKICGYSISIPTTPSLFTLARIEELCEENHFMDIRNLQSLQQIIATFNPDIIFHLAAQPLVRLSYEIPLETFLTNAIGTANILECLRETKNVRSAIIVTTDKCYENIETNTPFQEDDKLGGHDPYSSSKACAELITNAYRRSFFTGDKQDTAIASVRAGNVIGGGDWALDRIVPDVILSLLKNDKLSLRNPHAVRPWQHVLEPLAGYIELAEKNYDPSTSIREAFNFGPSIEDCITVLELVKKITAAWNEKQDLSFELTAHNPSESHILRLDNNKALAKLGWNPKWNVNTAVLKTVNWYKNVHLNNQDARTACINDIHEYLKIN